MGAFAQAGALDGNFSGDGKADIDFSEGDGTGSAIAQGPNGDIYVAGHLTLPAVGDLIPTRYMGAIVRMNQDGSLDNGFSGNGRLLFDFYGRDIDEMPWTRFRSITVQPDGKLVVVGETAQDVGVTSTSPTRFGIARFTSAGNLDTDFSDDGLGTFDFNAGAECRPWDVAIQNNGKIVVAGWTRISSSSTSEINFAVARLGANGGLDPNFTDDGRVQVDFGSHDAYAHALAIQSDDKIVLAGTFDNSASSSIMAVARLQINGLLDNTFGTSGKYLHGNSDSYYDNAWDVGIDGSGRAVVVGEYSSSSGTGDVQPILFRLNTNGTSEGEYSFTPPQGNGGGLRALAFQCDGKIVVSGYSVDTDDDEDFMVARINTNGSLDNTFATNGMNTSAFGYGNDWASGIAVRSSDQYITIAGSATWEDGDVRFGIARYQVETGIVPPAPTITFNAGECEMTASGSGTFEWYHNGVQLSGNGNTIHASEVGPYWVYVTSPNGCTSLAGSYTLSQPCDVGIDEPAQAVYHVSAYPNPVQDNVTVAYTLAAGTELGIHLQDVLGRPVATLLPPTRMAAGEQRRTLQLPATLAHGNYLLVFSTPEGRSTVRVTK